MCLMSNILYWKNLLLKQGCTQNLKILAHLSTLATHLLHLITCPILQTRSLTRLLHEQHSINFVQVDLRSKLSIICEKLYKHDVPFLALAPDEQLLWSAYDLDDIMFFLTGDQNFCPDYTVYNRIYQTPRIPQPHVVLPQPQQFVVPPPQGPRPLDRAGIDPRNIVADPRARRAKTLANRLIYLHARSHSM